MTSSSHWDSADHTIPLGNVSQGLSHCQPLFLASHPSHTPSPHGPAAGWEGASKNWEGLWWEDPLAGVPPHTPNLPNPPPNLPHLPQPPAHQVGLNAFLLNSYKTEYKILASTIVIKENFNSAVSGHLVHTVKCFFLCGFFFPFLFLFFLSFFFFF